MSEQGTQTTAVEELVRDPASRRRFMTAVGAAGAAGFAVVLSACGSKTTKSTEGGSNPNTAAGVGTDQYGPGDVGIVRYALTLEYIESAFYAAAIASGKLKGKALDLARKFGEQENEHVKTLEAAVGKLGSQPPAKPKTAFPLATQASILAFASELENLGAAAYLGQADRIQSKELLASALAIHSVEGRHAADLALLLGKDPTPNGAFAMPSTAADTLQQLHTVTAAAA
jgi:rubrerythrin